jgi:hypothetical protein
MVFVTLDHLSERSSVLTNLALFRFIHATHSRERLLTSRKMLTCLLTHHQVMANFLDFVFPFGMKEYPEDYHFSGFREETRISFSDTRLNIPQLGRTGFELRMCYSLRTVEPSDNDPNWPWSIRQTAIYHSFDVKSGKSFWIVIKGSNLIRDRVQAATAPKIGDQPELKSFETTAKAFNSTLATHLLLCDWCNEDWRWYLNFLEKEVQRLTRRSLAVAVTKAPSLIEASAYYPVPEPPMSLFRSVSTFTKRTLSIPRQFSFASSLREKTWFKPSFPVREELIQYPSSEPASPRPPPVLPPHLRQPKPEGAPSESSDFSFEKLQKVQFIEDNVNEVQLVLEANIKTLTELKEHYRSVFNSADCPPDIKSYSQGKMAHFGKRISQIVGDLEMQLSSTRTLLRLVQNRKSLVRLIILRYQVEGFAASPQN